jgi:hypothetical protein
MSFIHRLLKTFGSLKRELELVALHVGEPLEHATKRRKTAARKLDPG